MNIGKLLLIISFAGIADNLFAGGNPKELKDGITHEEVVRGILDNKNLRRTRVKRGEKIYLFNKGSKTKKADGKTRVKYEAEREADFSIFDFFSFKREVLTFSGKGCSDTPADIDSFIAQSSQHKFDITYKTDYQGRNVFFVAMGAFAAAFAFLARLDRTR